MAFSLRTWLRNANFNPVDKNSNNNLVKKVRDLESQIKLLQKEITKNNRNLKKIHRHNLQSLNDAYEFIDTNRKNYSVSTLCLLLNVVITMKEKIGKRETNQKLLRALITVHEKYPAMGLDSIYHFLKPKYGASRARIHRLMVKFDIHSIRTKIYKHYKNSAGADFAPNLLNRNFATDTPNKVWVGDITYIPTLEGWLYLAIVKDLCTKKIVGYAFSAHPDSKLVCDSLILALKRQKPNANFIFHRLSI